MHDWCLNGKLFSCQRPLLMSADNLCKQFGPRSGLPRYCSWKSFLKKLILKKVSRWQQKHTKFISIQRVKKIHNFEEQLFIFQLLAEILLTLYLIDMPFNTCKQSRAAAWSGSTLFANGNMIRYHTLVDLTSNFFVLCANVKVYLYNYS